VRIGGTPNLHAVQLQRGVQSVAQCAPHGARAPHGAITPCQRQPAVGAASVRQRPHARAAGRLQKRNTAKGQRAKENRSAEKASAVVGAEGDGEWEKALSLINFGFARPTGSDLSKFKSVLFSAKAKGVPVAASQPSKQRPGMLGGLI